MKGDGQIIVATAGILYGSVSVGGSLLAKTGLSALEISFFFLAFSLIPLIPFAIRQGLVRKTVESWRYLSVYGMVGTGLILLQFESLVLGLQPAVSALLLYTQPIWTIIFGKALFSENIGRAKTGMVVVGLRGVLLIVNPESSFREIGSSNFFGELSALAGGIFLSLWIILGKKGRLENFKSPGEMAFAVRGSTLVFVSLSCFSTIALGYHTFFESPELITANLIPLFAFSVVAGAMPDYLVYRGIEKLQSLQIGVLLLLEPISSAILSAILLISSLTLFEVAGGCLILFSNYLFARSNMMNKTKNR